MESEIEKKGTYERFETSKGHEILVLNNTDWFAIVEGNYGEILVKSDSDHKKEKSIGEGKFYLADVEDDPEFNDVPHLFLEDENGKYKEWILPKGLPDIDNKQKKLVKTDHKLAKKKV